jgi:hypothetical protein
MDHIFEQKLVRENHQLQFELAKLNKQIKQLQEKVVGYEQMINELNLMGSIKTATSQGYKTGGILGAAKGAVGGAVRAVKHNVGQMTSIKDVVSQNDPRYLGIRGARIRGVIDRSSALYMNGLKTMQSAENSVTDSGRTQPNASPSRLSDVVRARLRGKTPPTFDGARKPAEGLVNPTDVTVNSGQQSMYARGKRQSDRGLKATLNAGWLNRKRA